MAESLIFKARVLDSREPNCIKLCWCVQHTPYSCRTNLKLIFSNPSLCARHFKGGFDNLHKFSFAGKKNL